MGRDNFTKPTVEALGKRVGYLCSNPSCKKHTIGPNSEEEKSSLIGIAAHITAASPNGPRYDVNMTQEQRKHISNGIWLCCNCSTIIDKDPDTFPMATLLDWKYRAETEMRNALFGDLAKEPKASQKPFIEADLIWSNAMRANTGYSPKNFEKYGGSAIPVGSKPIIFWELSWRFSLVLHNNSSYPAYNIRINEASEVKFSNLTKLPKKNNLPPFANIDLEAKHIQLLEGDSDEATTILNEKIPVPLEGLKLLIEYEDENRETHSTQVLIKNQELLNK